MIDREALRKRANEYYEYNKDTGSFFYKERPASEFSKHQYIHHCKRIGKEAGSVNREGYVKIWVDKKIYSAHKIAWLIIHGEWVNYPEFEIDHINGDRSDNRIENLRKVSKSGNQRNSGRRITNTSGVHGVHWCQRNKKWIARIWNGSRHVYLGQFNDLRESAIARQAAERVLGFTGTDRESNISSKK